VHDFEMLFLGLKMLWLFIVLQAHCDMHECKIISMLN